MKTSRNRYTLLLLIWSLLLFTACNTRRHVFDHKILRYSKYLDDTTFIVNTSFIDYYADTIHLIRYPFSMYDEDYRDRYAASQTTVPFETWMKRFYQQSQPPFQFVRKGERIHLQYPWKGELKDLPYFNLSKNDTLPVEVSFSNLCFPISGMQTVRLPKDSILVIDGRRLHCWVFAELYTASVHKPVMRLSKLIYLDKRSFLPVQICEVWDHLNDDETAVLRREIWRETVDSVFARPWNPGEQKWRYPLCWKP